MKSHGKFLGKKRRKGDKNNVGYYTTLSAGAPIILVDCCDVDDDLQPVKSYRWFQVPTDFCERN